MNGLTGKLLSNYSHLNSFLVSIFNHLKKAGILFPEQETISL